MATFKPRAQPRKEKNNDLLTDPFFSPHFSRSDSVREGILPFHKAQEIIIETQTAIATLAIVSEKDGFSVTTFCSGDGSLFYHAAMPLADALKQFPQEQEERLGLERLQMTVRNDAFVAAAIFGVVIFVGNRLSGKFLDDVYTVLIQPRIKPVLEQIDATLRNKFTRHKPKRIFNWTLWHEEFQVWVSVSLVGEFQSETGNRLDIMKHVHRNALKWIA